MNEIELKLLDEKIEYISAEKVLYSDNENVLTLVEGAIAELNYLKMAARDEMQDGFEPIGVDAESYVRSKRDVFDAVNILIPNSAVVDKFYTSVTNSALSDAPAYEIMDIIRRYA